MNKHGYYISLWLLLAYLPVYLFACGKKGGGDDPGPPANNTCIYLGVDTCQQKPKTTVVVNLNDAKQTIHSFGAGEQGVTDPVMAAGSLMFSAYKDESGKKLVVVVVNPEAKDKLLQLTGDTGALHLNGNSVAVYTTDFAYNCRKTVNAVNNITVPSRSVVTLVGTYE